MATSFARQHCCGQERGKSSRFFVQTVDKVVQSKDIEDTSAIRSRQVELQPRPCDSSAQDTNAEGADTQSEETSHIHSDPGNESPFVAFVVHRIDCNCP